MTPCGHGRGVHGTNRDRRSIRSAAYWSGGRVRISPSKPYELFEQTAGFTSVGRPLWLQCLVHGGAEESYRLACLRERVRRGGQNLRTGTASNRPSRVARSRGGSARTLMSEHNSASSTSRQVFEVRFRSHP